MIILLLVIIAFSAVVATLLFGDSPNYRNTPVHTFHTLLIRTNSYLVAQVQANKHIYSALRWLVPVFYVCVIIFCILQFFKWVYPALDLAILHSHFHSAYIALSITSVFFSTVLVTFSDPGTLTAENCNLACSQFANNGLIFFDKSCHTCKLPKPARSKHCSTCNRCVLLFDHHCIWINNCVGYRTYRWFLMFLVLNINMMVYGGYLCMRELRNQPRPKGWWKLIVALSESNRIAGILLILAVFISLITVLFTGLHIRYLYLGVTTNEAEKWGEIEHLVNLGALFHIRERNEYVEQASLKLSDGAYEVVYLSLRDGEIVLTEKNTHSLTLKKVSLVEKDLENMYDRGFWENARERVLI